MSDKPKFDPHWPHGHDCILGDGTRLDAKIRVSDLAGRTPIAAEITSTSNYRYTWLFTCDGVCSGARLINKPAPGPVVEKTFDSVTVVTHSRANTVYYAKVKTTIEFFSDGSVRASAKVIEDD